jgi:hypothetical protein
MSGATERVYAVAVDDLDVAVAGIEPITRRPKLFENQLLIGVYAQTVVAKIDAYLVVWLPN